MVQVSYAHRPTLGLDEPQKELPPEHIRLKLIEVERLDMRYDFGSFKLKVEGDPDVSAWWVYWVYQTLFVWRFLFGKTLSTEGRWLHENFKAAVGQNLYAKKINETLAYLESVGETVEENI